MTYTCQAGRNGNLSDKLEARLFYVSCPGLPGQLNAGAQGRFRRVRYPKASAATRYEIRARHELLAARAGWNDQPDLRLPF